MKFGNDPLKRFAGIGEVTRRLVIQIPLGARGWPLTAKQLRQKVSFQISVACNSCKPKNTPHHKKLK